MAAKRKRTTKGSKFSRWVCPKCSRRKTAEAPPFCDCNPSAPFRMESVRARDAVDGLIERLKPATQTGQVIRSITEAGIRVRYLGVSCYAVERSGREFPADTGHEIVIAFDEETGTLEGIFTRAPGKG